MIINDVIIIDSAVLSCGGFVWDYDDILALAASGDLAPSFQGTITMMLPPWQARASGGWSTPNQVPMQGTRSGWSSRPARRVRRALSKMHAGRRNTSSCEQLRHSRENKKKQPTTNGAHRRQRLRKYKVHYIGTKTRKNSPTT